MDIPKDYNMSFVACLILACLLVDPGANAHYQVEDDGITCVCARCFLIVTKCVSIGYLCTGHACRCL